jgi:hypothetical protein
MRPYVICILDDSFDPTQITTWFEEDEMMRKHVKHWIACGRSVFFTCDIFNEHIARKLENRFNEIRSTLYILVSLEKFTTEGRLPLGIWNLIRYSNEASPDERRFRVEPTERPSIPPLLP